MTKGTTTTRKGKTMENIKQCRVPANQQDKMRDILGLLGHNEKCTIHFSNAPGNDDNGWYVVVFDPPQTMSDMHHNWHDVIVDAIEKPVEES